LCERLIRNKNTTLYPYWYLAGIYFQKGLYAKAREYIDDYVVSVHNSDVWHYYAAETCMAEGDSEGALAEIEKAQKLSPTSFASRRYNPYLKRGDTYFFMGDFVSAEKEYQLQPAQDYPLGKGQAGQSLSWLYMTQGRLREARDQAASVLEILQELGWAEDIHDVHFGLSTIHLAAGNLDKALAECEAGDSEKRFDGRHMRSLKLKTVILARMKEFEAASKTAEQFREEIEEYYQDIASRNPFAGYYNLLGNIELEKGNFAEAVDQCLLAKSLFPAQHNEDYILFIDPLAEAYYQSGNRDSARKEYELAASLTFGRFQWGDLYAQAFFRRGKIHEELGNMDAAIENYQKFIELWKDCDPELQPLVEQARVAIERLR